MRFHDRREAGKALAVRLAERSREGGLPDPVVLALPRGGLPVADEIARVLGAPLDIIVARKIGAPGQPELGVGAVAGDGPPKYDARLLRQLGLTEADLASAAERERVELRRREELYRQGRGAPELAGRSVVLVDDGLATGSTVRAALRALRAAAPARIIVAVPVCAPDATGLAGPDADEVLCLHRPRAFGAVGFWYDDFAQLTDDDVLTILRAAPV